MCRCNNKARRKEQHIQHMQFKHAKKENRWIAIGNNIIERFNANCVSKHQGRNKLIDKYYKAQRMIAHHKGSANALWAKWDKARAYEYRQIQRKRRKNKWFEIEARALAMQEYTKKTGIPIVSHVSTRRTRQKNFPTSRILKFHPALKDVNSRTQKQWEEENLNHWDAIRYQEFKNPDYPYTSLPYIGIDPGVKPGTMAIFDAGGRQLTNRELRDLDINPNL